LQLMSYQESVRNVCVVGHLHHGKTALMDMLVYETHQMDWDVDRPVRFQRRCGLANAIWS
jgi:U5 small nuclear ribonucleoprotein component